MSDPRETYPIREEVSLAWGDMDAFQHVNNTVYFRWFESARIAYFQRTRVLEVMESTGVGPILAATDCRFRIPLTYPDRVTALARVSQLGSDRFLMDYAVHSETSSALAAEGHGLIVMFDYRNQRKAALPDEVRERILSLEKEVGNQPAPYERPR